MSKKLFHLVYVFCFFFVFLYYFGLQLYVEHPNARVILSSFISKMRCWLHVLFIAVSDCFILTFYMLAAVILGSYIKICTMKDRFVYCLLTMSTGALHLISLWMDFFSILGVIFTLNYIFDHFYWKCSLLHFSFRYL